MQILLVNDSSNYFHVGCQAVSRSHAALLGQNGHTVKKRLFTGVINPNQFKADTDKIDSYLSSLFEGIDAVVVNGEGSIHHNRNIQYLELLEHAQKAGLKTLLVNSVLQEIDGFESVFNRLDALTVRDSNSKNYMLTKGIESLLRPDSFIGADFSDTPLINLSGKSSFTCWHPHRAEAGNQIMTIYKNLPDSKRFFLPIHSEAVEAWRNIPATFGTSKIIITGRHHGIYCAMFNASPFIAFESNTWKVDGFKGLCPSLEEYLCPADPYVAINSALHCPENFVEAKDILDGFLPLDIFSELGDGSLPDGQEGKLRELQRLEDDIAAFNNKSPNHDLAMRLMGRNLEVSLAIST